MPSEYAVFARDGAAIRVIFAARWPESCASIAVRKPRPGLRRDGNYHLPFAATAARTSASSCSGEELGSFCPLMKKVGVPRTPTARASAMSCSIHAIASAEGLARAFATRSEEHTYELQSLMRNSYALICLKK